MKARTDAVYTPIIPLESKFNPLTFTLPIPAGSKYFVVCLRMDGCLKVAIDTAPVTKGMRVVGCGRL